MKFIFLFIGSIIAFSSAAQVTFMQERIGLDDSLKIAIIQIPNNTLLLQRTSFITKNGSISHLKVSNLDSLYTKPHWFKKDDTAYKAYVTALPLIKIYAPNGIVNKPKSLATISYAYEDTVITSYAGIELRGSSSLVFPKKTYDINFYKDSTGTKNQDFKFAGMREDDDWILDGLYNEPLRMRSYLSLNLWNDIHTPYYLEREPDAKAGAQGTYAEVFLNNRYQGVFLLQEQVDRKLLQIKKIEGDTLRGELFQGARYLGASSFDSIPPKKNYLASWGGYDIKYPTPTNVYWDNVYPFTDFVVNSENSAFAKAINEKFVIDNAIDYFLYINAVRAPDNLGKNLYLARYDEGEPYFYAPWDLDGSFGTIFSGKRINTTDDFLTNGLLRRLIKTDAGNFIERFKKRWKELRAGVLSTENLLLKQQTTYNNLKNNLIFEREALVWSDFNYNNESIEYMHDWTERRLQFLDTYIAQLSKNGK